MQADSEVRDEIDLQLQLIDNKLKASGLAEKEVKQVDVYDLNPNSDAIKSHTNL